MKWLLINPRSEYLENDAAYPPSGLMHVAKEVEARGHNVSIMDMAGDTETDCFIPCADIYGITCVTPNVKAVKMIANRISYLWEESKILIGGPHATFLPENTAKQITHNSIISGEFEVVADEVILDLENNELKERYVAESCARHWRKPARNLVDLHRYSPGGKKCTPVYTSRGCVYDCRFCAKINGKGYVTTPLKQTLEEIEEVIDAGFDSIVFGDDNIGINEKRLVELLNAIRPYNINFRLNRDVRNLKEKTFELAAKAGCTDISFGVETGSQKMLHRMNKRSTVADNEKAIRLTKKYGMKAKCYFMVNFPGEDEKTVSKTLAFAKKANPDSWLLSNFVPLPGSHVYHNSDQYDITWISKDWDDYFLVGKGNKFNFCYTTGHLTHDKQMILHYMMKLGLEMILGR